MTCFIKNSGIIPSTSPPADIAELDKAPIIPTLPPPYIILIDLFARNTPKSLAKF